MSTNSFWRKYLSPIVQNVGERGVDWAADSGR